MSSEEDQETCEQFAPREHEPVHPDVTVQIVDARGTWRIQVNKSVNAARARQLFAWLRTRATPGGGVRRFTVTQLHETAVEVSKHAQSFDATRLDIGDALRATCLGAIAEFIFSDGKTLRRVITKR